jgi:serine/threonine protein kinase
VSAAIEEAREDHPQDGGGPAHRHRGRADASRALRVGLGQCSDKGRKHVNQDFHGAVLPDGAALSLKGVALAIADGISSSPVSQVAAEMAVKLFLSDYYCTSEAWSVRTAGLSVITASNAWLYNETRQSHCAYDRDRGYVCTFSALVLKGRFAHIFHAGDSRIHRVCDTTLEPLTNDHRFVISGAESYLGRALGMGETVEIDYSQHAVEEGDLFVLSTDGLHAFVGPKEIVSLIRSHASDLDEAARQLVQRALERGSDDNITVQLVRVEALPDGDPVDFASQTDRLPLPPIPEVPGELDGYRLQQQIHASDRSHIYLATDPDTGALVVLKIPSLSLREQPHLLRQFTMEEWIARRVCSPHLLKAGVSRRPRQFLYGVSEHVEGQSLRQWMYDHRKPDLHTVRGIVDQIVKGLRALHRKEMVHCDLRPENVMIDRNGTVKIIDFGSVRVAGLAELAGRADVPVLGTVQYTAPEWMAGEAPTWRSDLFSVAVIAYEMLTGQLPYGAEAARVRTPSQQHALRYRSARSPTTAVPDWVDGALRKALHPDPLKRYDAMSEFMDDLTVPNSRFQLERHAPLLERDPVLFWKGVCLVLFVLVVVLLALLR